MNIQNDYAFSPVQEIVENKQQKVIKKESITAASLQHLRNVSKLKEVTEATADVIEELNFVPEEFTDTLDLALEPFKVSEGFFAGKKMFSAVKMIPQRSTKQEVVGDLWTIVKSLQKIPATFEVCLKYLINHDPSSWSKVVDLPIRSIGALTTCVSLFQLRKKLEVIWDFQQNTNLSNGAKLSQMKRALEYTKQKQSDLSEIKLVSPEDRMDVRLDDIMQRLRSKKPKVRSLALHDGKELIGRLHEKISFQKPVDFIDIACKAASTASSALALVSPVGMLPFALIDATSAVVQLANYLYAKKCCPITS